jgi:hypothetical protein
MKNSISQMNQSVQHQQKSTKNSKLVATEKQKRLGKFMTALHQQLAQ